MDNDAELLRQYVDERSETAFAELVQRHLPLVYAAALQQVAGARTSPRISRRPFFTALACKAVTLSDRVTLAG